MSKQTSSKTPVEQPSLVRRLQSPRTHEVIWDDSHGHPGVDTCKNCDSNSLRYDWRFPCANRKKTADPADSAKLEISDVRWEYEDQLPKMEDSDFDAIFPASRVLGMECGGVRMYPYVEDSAGNRVWISSLPNMLLNRP